MTKAGRVYVVAGVGGLFLLNASAGRDVTLFPSDEDVIAAGRAAGSSLDAQRIIAERLGNDEEVQAIVAVVFQVSRPSVIGFLTTVFRWQRARAVIREYKGAGDAAQAAALDRVAAIVFRVAQWFPL